MTVRHIKIDSLSQIKIRFDKVTPMFIDQAEQKTFGVLNNKRVAGAIQKMTPYSGSDVGKMRYSRVPRGSRTQKKVMPKNIGKMNMRRNFKVERTQDGVRIGYTGIPYAKHLHDIKKPAAGDYWSPGKKGGWTTPGTGPRFVMTPLENEKDWISERSFLDLLKWMKSEGL